jgi:dolichol-phosphate mannosyltransferase
MNSPASTLVVIATYNEIENLPPLTDEIFRYAPNVDVLVIDDGSPDGTGRWCDERAQTEPRFQVIHRPRKLGLGSATALGLRHALAHDYQRVLVMDADFSHHPRYIPDLLAGVTPDGAESGVDVMIGSRYAPGGGVEAWTWHRRWMSRAINAYTRLLLGLRIRDCSSAFRCYRSSALARIDLESLRSHGYGFVEEILWRLQRAGARLGETPIVFVNRQHGHTKINVREALGALWTIFRLSWQGGRGRS